MEWSGEKNYLQKKTRVSTGFYRVFAHPGPLLHPNWSGHQVDPPGQTRFNNYDTDHSGWNIS